MAAPNASKEGTMLVKTVPPDTIVCAIAANGYESHIAIPVTENTERMTAEFCKWFEMQLDFFKRWQPGVTATIRESRPAEEA